MLQSKIYNILYRFIANRKGDEYAQKAVIVILVVIGGVAAFAAFGQKIVALINQATSGM